MQISEQLIAYLDHHLFAKGDQLPTEHQLMELFAVSRTTIRKALQILMNKGLIIRSQGSGTFFNGNRRNRKAASGKQRIGLANYFYLDYIYTEILKGIEEEIEEAGYGLVISNNPRTDDAQFEAIARLIDQGVSGIILEPTLNLQIQPEHPVLKLLSEKDIPVVSTHRPIENGNFSTVTIDDVHAGTSAAEYLLGMGHTRIGYIYKQDVKPIYDRYKGFSDALAKAGYPLEDRYCVPDFDITKAESGLFGYLLTKRMINENREPPTAIFYFNDNLAIQGYKALAEMGMRVPEDISVLGFDDHGNAALVSPPLTTFSHPKAELGRWAAKILLDEMQGGAVHPMPMTLEFKPRLVERGSVRRIRT